MAGTGICSGEGGVLPEELGCNPKYFYELASIQFGFSWDILESIQAFHFKGGIGTGGHLAGEKVSAEIAEVRDLKQGEAAISPVALKDLCTSEDFAKALMLGADVIEIAYSALQAIRKLNDYWYTDSFNFRFSNNGLHFKNHKIKSWIKKLFGIKY